MTRALRHRDCDDERRFGLAWQTKDKVMFAVNHPKSRVKLIHLLERSVPNRKANDSLFELENVGTDLFVSPSLVGIADDLTQGVFGYRRQNLGSS